MARLIETVFQESAPEKVDRENGILFGVRVLGLESVNGYGYTEKCCRDAVPKYEGIKSYLDHPTGRNLNEDRSVKDWTGVFRNPRFVEGSGVHADHHLLKSSPYYGGIIEAAERFPKAIGYSHVADGDKIKRGAKSFVDSISRVHSVDNVTEPATTKGIFESKGGLPDVPETLQEFIEALPSEIPAPQRTKLIEAITAAWPVAGGPTANPEFQITLALLNSVQELARSIVDANSKTAEADAAKKAADDKAAADKVAADKAKSGDPGANVPPTLEAMQRRLALADAKAMLLESGRAAKDEKVRALQIETLADVKGDDKRKSLLESWPKAGEAKLRESRPFDRPGSSPPATGGGNGSEAGPMSESLKGVLDRRRETLKEGKIRQFAY